ncbi:maleylacetoacetate isomerase [Kaistia dalseonensis]|uniref:Maleylacetoacetate isomerase/maleylpyruvate isomerase n=1 Tax=Kaistia dalseonensis TaxID=410840 RepID=A0ABU0HAA2_9HYPH|nr:maleylacetoacetate isomerase [Kaistia dalseonensis]MCX5496625.1 maleylacetoacetate isomerase [Kaistia dalseonensis]MDQ0439248.1 maleylacetoacetate isomerase/maleylpyruvate isomerase [Kaistia dalseonensis]
MRALYTFFRSSTSYRVRIALAVKGLDWEAHYISLPRMEHRAPDYMDLNPQGLVPALVEEGRAIAQSLAILEYLDETYPEPPFLPGDAFDRAYIRGLSQIIGCDIHPLNNVRVLKWLKERWGVSDSERNEWYAHWVVEGFRAFEATLVKEARHGTYCFGDQLTMADICLVPQIANARRFNCDLSAYPLTVAIADRAAALPAIQAVAPQTQADAF